ncbi:MAG: hypothetical protein QMD36_03445 [Candidatus Aenigmarchaeota archaeon]|nr:hypothetical protein [Candidatus Aenigmarchaeota archaeon]
MKIGLKIVSTFVFVILGIFIIAFFAQYITTGTNFFETLGMIFSEKCRASLSLETVSGCTMKARILSSNCLGKEYKISEDSCSSDARCYGTINYDSFQASCAWTDLSGSHDYILCVDGKKKDSKSITC